MIYCPVVTNRATGWLLTVVKVGLRLVQAARLSRMREASTSLDKQDVQVRAWADAMGHEVVGTASDVDVSGSTSPFTRPELGPWLRSDRLADYDGIVASKLDRLARSTRYWSELLRWANDHGKVIICLDPMIDFSTPTGQLIGYIMAWLAEQELAQITTRSRETQTWLEANGYLHGRPPYGYRVAEAGSHKTLEPDPGTAPLVRELFERVAAGESARRVAMDLGIRPMTATQMLRNRSYLGQRRNAAGAVILRYDPIVTARLFRDAETALQRRGTAAPIPRAASLLGGLLTCARCGGTMYAHGSEPWRYYRCKGAPPLYASQCRNMIRMDYADHRAEVFMASLTAEVRERELVAGNDHAAELTEAEAELFDLPRRRLDRATEDAERDRLRAEYDRIAALPAEPDRWEWRSTGETYAQRWTLCATNDERRELLKGKVHFRAMGGKLRPEVTSGDYLASLPLAITEYRGDNDGRKAT